MDLGVSWNPKSYTHIVLPPNMDSSSFAGHHTWQAGLSQMGAKINMTLFAVFYKYYYIITFNKLSVSGRHRPPPDLASFSGSLG